MTKLVDDKMTFDAFKLEVVIKLSLNISNTLKAIKSINFHNNKNFVDFNYNFNIRATRK